MSSRSRAARSLALLCFWVAILMCMVCMGSTPVAGIRPYCGSPNPPSKPPEGLPVCISH
ncbi:hypothetical protein SEVIR_1G038300v4 [Setaria viridis]|uniref:Uncharacterized protein n=2 Tax=Setaria TaxID=4554 RepID=A0A368PGJ3_SETIT